MIIWAAGIVLGATALIAGIRAITRAIYYGTVPPSATDITHESTTISRDGGHDRGDRVCVAPPATDDGRDIPRVATIRDDAVRGHCVRRTRKR